MAKKMNDLENYITTSRHKIKEQLIEYFKEYMQLDDVEIRKSSALGYLIQVLSILTSNQLMYSTMTHRESTLVTAQLPESIYDWSAYLGYTPNKAIPATVEALFELPLQNIQESIINIPEGFKVKADDIEFINENRCEITFVSGNIQIYLYTDFGKTLIPYHYDQQKNSIAFILSLLQYSNVEHNFLIPQELKQYQFHIQNVPLRENNYLYDVSVFIDDEEWAEYKNIFEMNSSTKGYTFTYSDQSINIFFGNGLFGKQPKPGSDLKVILKETQGERGNIIPGSLTQGDRLYRINQNGSLVNFSYQVTNPSPGYNGRNQETVNETRGNAIASLESLHRLVSNNDFKNINKIIPIMGKDVKSILKRSDIKCNEILLYSVLNFYEDIPTPTITYYKTIPNTVEKIKPFSVFEAKGKEFYCPFELRPDYQTLEVNYFYYSRDVDILLNIEKLDIENMPFFIRNLNVTSDFDNEKFTFRLNVTDIDDDVDILDYNVRLFLSQGNYSKNIQFILYQDNDVSYYYYVADFDEILAAHLDGKLFIEKNNADEFIAEYSCKVHIKLDLYNYCRSQMKLIDEDNGEYTIYDIPLIEKKWFDDLNIGSGVDLRNDFEMRLVQNMINNIDRVDIRMTNTYVSNKFANTIGEIDNLLLVKENYNVIDNVKSYDDLINNYDINNLVYGNMFLINGDLLSDDKRTKLIQIEDENDMFFNKETMIAKFIKLDSQNNPIWEFIQPTVSDSVLIESSGIKLFFDGNEWFKPHYYTPISFKIIAYLKDFSLSYAEYIKDELYNWLKENKFGIEVNLYRSEIIRLVQSLDNVVFCKLLEPRIDVTFDFNLDEIGHENLLRYSPQYIYTERDLIDVRVEMTNKL